MPGVEESVSTMGIAWKSRFFANLKGWFAKPCEFGIVLRRTNES